MMQPHAPLPRLMAWAVALLIAAQLAAQDGDAFPAPEGILESVTPVAAPPLPAPAPGPRAMSDWDLYAGSIYANTSPLWVEAEYLLWWMRGNELPPLVTTSPAGTPREDAGVWGEPGTRTLLGGRGVDERARSGFRTSLGVRLGHWFDALMDSELQFDYLWLGDGQHSGDFQADWSEQAILARPFFNTELGRQDAQLIALPYVVAGGIAIETSSDLRAAGVMFRREWLRGSRGSLAWLTGYRYLELQERWDAREQILVTEPGGAVAMGTTFDILEGVSTWNEFHGGDLGVQWRRETGRWTWEVVARIALGGVARTVEIGGDTLIESPDGSAVIVPGGLLALPTNLGRHHSSRFATLPELSIRLRRQLTHHLALTVGYSLMAADHIVRTGDQLDLCVNPTQLNGGALGGPARPAVLMSDSTLCLHGLNIGLEW